jgi:hypothetical protein
MAHSGNLAFHDAVKGQAYEDIHIVREFVVKIRNSSVLATSLSDRAKKAKLTVDTLIRDVITRYLCLF